MKSWAVPKGLPPRPGIMRLAVSTEDHPLEYINFEGTIPKGQYGGGRIWMETVKGERFSDMRLEQAAETGTRACRSCGAACGEASFCPECGTKIEE